MKASTRRFLSAALIPAPFSELAIPAR